MGRPLFNLEQRRDYAKRVEKECLRNQPGGPLYKMLKLNYGSEVADNNASRHLMVYIKACKSAKLEVVV